MGLHEQETHCSNATPRATRLQSDGGYAWKMNSAVWKGITTLKIHRGTTMKRVSQRSGNGASVLRPSLARCTSMSPVNPRFPFIHRGRLSLSPAVPRAMQFQINYASNYTGRRQPSSNIPPVHAFVAERGS